MRKQQHNFLKAILPSVLAGISLSLQGAVLTVTNTNDTGSGSLRNALTSAALTNGPHTINFNIPDTDPNYNSVDGVWLISPASNFTYLIKNDIVIDGTTQTSNQGNRNPLGPEIVIDGNNHAVNYCLSIINASGIAIKGFVISGFLYGIQMYGSASQNNIISGNFIGTNAAGNGSAGNYIGIEIISGADNNIIGGTTAAERNIISGNEHIGIRILDADNNIVTGNYVGVNRTGVQALGNVDGISIEGNSKYNRIGGSTPAERNIVSGNTAYGIPVFGAGAEGNVITGNFIGTDATGMFAIPNTYGVLFDDGAYNNIAGGSNNAERNIISGNSAYGVFIYNMGTNSNVVRGNYIGVNVSGTSALPNAIGIVVDGAAYKHRIEDNILSGNLQQGIFIHITGCDSTMIARNKIGTDAGGLPMGNGSDGIRIAEGPKHTLIGGSPAAANVIANNGGSGVSIMFPDDDNHLISFNSIYSNSGLGIDLFPPGINANDAGDADTGANDEMNYPEIDTVLFVSATSETIISGTLDTDNPQLCAIQIFKAEPDDSGHGEGMEYLSTVTPATSGFWSDTLNGLAPTDFLTAIAIDGSNNTSEFSIARNITTIASIINNTDYESMAVYPNPCHGTFTVFGKAISVIEIADVEGRVIKTVQPKTANPVVDISAQAKGAYFVRITGNKKYFTEIIILK